MSIAEILQDHNNLSSLKQNYELNMNQLVSYDGSRRPELREQLETTELVVNAMNVIEDLFIQQINYSLIEMEKLSSKHPEDEEFTEAFEITVSDLNSRLPQNYKASFIDYLR
ncbi:MAG: hypothetical protein KC535_01040 [Nanoarchaeota archaeon]|nr:hypothetical protein [Nanoarchaeota archaeon]